jgi:hypothetical protein
MHNLSPFGDEIMSRDNLLKPKAAHFRIKLKALREQHAQPGHSLL